MNFNACLDGCAPIQVININFAFSVEDNIQILDSCNNAYDLNTIEFAYSVDLLCWSCYMNYETFLQNVIGLNSDYYLRLKVHGQVNGIVVNGENIYDYNTSIDTCFEFSYQSALNTAQNLYNPYLNMDSAISLAQQLTENVTAVVGVPCYYFKLAPEATSKDITFKEYALMNVESVKQLKIIIADNQMPSSKPEFNDWGLDWQTDWETEISKGSFATAFGINAQPQEGDLVYIPMMKRMWMVNEAYEEKKDAFMWNATTFKVALVKYQEKDSVDLKDTEAMVNSFVKNKYEDLFGDHENVGSGEESVEAPEYAADTLYPVFESDATRKYVAVDAVDFKQGLLYFRGTMIADDIYEWTGYLKGTIVYQRTFCGDSGTISFIIKPKAEKYSGDLLKIGNLKIKIKQSNTECVLHMINSNQKLTLKNNETYFVYFRYSAELNTSEFFAAQYVHADLPIYRLQNHHYWFDIDNGTRAVGKYDIELTVTNKSEILLYSFYGSITNIKVFDRYVDNVSEILQMYPTDSHLLVNDTARKIVSMNGITN